MGIEVGRDGQRRQVARLALRAPCAFGHALHRAVALRPSVLLTREVVRRESPGACGRPRLRG